MTKKELLESQRELLNIKVNQINQVQQQLDRMRIEFSKTITRMKEELGIPKKELNEWEFDKTERYFVRKKMLKAPKEEIPKKKAKRSKLNNED